VHIGPYRVNSPGMVKTKIVWKNLWLLTVNDSSNIDLQKYTIQNRILFESQEVRNSLISGQCEMCL